MSMDFMPENAVQTVIDAQENEYWFPYHYVAKFANDKFRPFFLDGWAINYASTIEYLLAKLRTQPGSRLVDIGCGDGRFSRELALANKDSQVEGVDYSKRAISLASAMNQDIGNLRFSSLDITQCHHLEPFDFAVLMEVFEHIPPKDADAFVAGVRALLKKGGILYLTVPHVNKPVEYKHFQHFSCESIQRYFRPYFNILEVVPFEKKSWARRLIVKLLNGNLFTLTNERMLSFVYRWYKANLFLCDSEKKCQRVFMKAVAK
jgi:2-polyprenyl-3-methyl-5-hydroxy-6-metoxy-1,4-benzoquinol methylase